MLEVVAILTEKLYVKNRRPTVENSALLGKIYKFLRIIYNLATFSSGCINTPCRDGPKFGVLMPFCSAFIADEKL